MRFLYKSGTGKVQSHCPLLDVRVQLSGRLQTHDLESFGAATAIYLARYLILTFPEFGHAKVQGDNKSLMNLLANKNVSAQQLKSKKYAGWA